MTFPHISAQMGSLKIDHIRDIRPDLLAGVDMSCLMHLDGLAAAQGRRVPHKHVVQILRDTLTS